MSQEEYERMKETIEVLSNQKLMKEIKESLEEVRRGEFVTLRELEDELRGHSS